MEEGIEIFISIEKKNFYLENSLIKVYVEEQEHLHRTRHDI